MYPGSELDTTKLEDGLVFVKDQRTETNDSKGIFGHHRNELCNGQEKRKLWDVSLICCRKARNEETRVEAEGLRQ